jgi:autoinducer 2-degrading protein
MTYVVCAKWIAREGETEAVAAAIQCLIEPSRNEAGILLYQPHRDAEDPGVFFFYEQYVDRAAYDAHLQSEHVQRHGLEDAIPRLASRERAYYELWP